MTAVASPDRELVDGAVQLPVAFARVLRAAGLDVAVGSTVLFAEALACVGLHERSKVYFAGRTTLVHRPEDLDTYTRAFAAFWDRWQPGRVVDDVVEEALPLVVAFDDDDDASDVPDDAADELDGDVVTVRWSAHEVLRARDFAAYTDDEFAEARRLVSDLRIRAARQRSRRRVRAARVRAGRIDLRRTVRSAMHTDGTPVRLHGHRPGTRPRRVVLLLDVSGSMEPYARAFVRFVHAAIRSRTRVEAFALGTRLTRMTRELQSRDPDAAIAAAAARVVDWSGGTRLGAGLREFNDRFGVRGIARGAIVVVLSDGWDRGDPTLLGGQMERLHRVAHRIVWVNPLKASDGYAPLAGGMAAALPFVDDFVEGHSIDALERVASLLGDDRQGAHR